MAILSAAIIMLLFVAATAKPTDPVKPPSGLTVIDPADAESVTEGDQIVAPAGNQLERFLELHSCLAENSTGNNACFEDYGDKFLVFDGKADGASAAVYWKTSYGRSGICYNSHGAGTLSQCNYNMREDGTVYWQACYQNRSAGGALYCTSSSANRRINGIE